MDLTVESKEKSGALYGGWSHFAPLNKEDKAVFNEAMKGMVGVGYTPLEVSKQIVNGINYKYICEAQVVYPGAKKSIVIVDIYAPINGAPTVSKISTVVREVESNSNVTLGGWLPWKPVTPEAKKVFVDVTKGLLGVSYTPLEFSTQVVAGMNYRFICEAHVVKPDTKPYLVMMEIYQPLGSKPAMITSIERIG
jgi:hypothetical protein